MGIRFWFVRKLFNRKIGEFLGKTFGPLRLVVVYWHKEPLSKKKHCLPSCIVSWNCNAPPAYQVNHHQAHLCSNCRLQNWQSQEFFSFLYLHMRCLYCCLKLKYFLDNGAILQRCFCWHKFFNTSNHLDMSQFDGINYIIFLKKDCISDEYQL